MSEKDSILITGGSGFLGINLIRFLLGKGEKDIMSLDVAGFDYPEKDVITVIQGDIRDRALVRECMKHMTWVIHTAAALPLYKKEDIFLQILMAQGTFLRLHLRILSSGLSIYHQPRYTAFRTIIPFMRMICLTVLGHMVMLKSRLRKFAMSFVGEACVYLFSGPKHLSGPNGWVSLHYYMTGPKMAEIFR